MHPKVIGCFLLALGLADAYIDAGSSRIYDEYDFIGQSTVTIDGLCAEQCRIFASITEETYKLASGILIQMPKGFYSIAGIAESIDPATNQKIFLEVKGVPSLTIVNANAQLAAGPMVIYVVKSEKYMPYPQPEVYEADVLHRPGTSIPKSVTVMSTRPFTVKQSAGSQPKPVRAALSGYDATDFGNCPSFQISESEFTFEVNGPIVTLNYSDFTAPPGSLFAAIGITNKLQMHSTGWVSSPGYSGCPGRQPYRSSLYDYNTPFHAEITNDQPAAIYADVVTNSDNDHPVTLTYPGTGGSYSVSGTEDSKPIGFNLYTQNLAINWTPDGTPNTHFLAKWRKN